MSTRFNNKYHAKDSGLNPVLRALIQQYLDEHLEYTYCALSVLCSTDEAEEVGLGEVSLGVDALDEVSLGVDALDEELLDAGLPDEGPLDVGLSDEESLGAGLPDVITLHADTVYSVDSAEDSVDGAPYSVGGAPYPASGVPYPQGPTPQSENLTEWLEQLDEPFSTTLLAIIDRKGLSDADVYKRAQISRQHFSLIRSQANYRPKKETVLALGIALELSIDEMNDLLQRAGFALSRASERDIIVEFFIRQNRYDLAEINEALFAFDQPLLCQRS